MVGENLRRLMTQRGITAKYLADKVEISPTHLSYVMNGKRNLTYELATKIANELNVSLAEIYGESEIVQTDDLASLNKNFPNVVKILRRDGKKITPDKERLIARIIETAIKDE